MTEAFEWQGRVGAAWAEEWRRTDRTLAPLNSALVAAAAPFGGGAILDIGCGAGATSLAFADAFAHAEVTGLDLSDDLVAQARMRAGGRSNLRFAVGDASSWRPPRDGAFDLIVSRHGVMFFADPVAAFTHLRTLAKPGGRLVFSCFRSRADNGWMDALRPVLARFAPEALSAPEPEAGPFAFAEPTRIRAILADAGFAPPTIAPLDFDFVVGAGDDARADALHYFRKIGPVARLLAELDADARHGAIEAIEDIVAANVADGRVAFRAAAWIVSTSVSKDRA